MQTLQLCAILGLVLSCITTTLLAGNLFREQFGTTGGNDSGSGRTSSTR